MRRESPGTSRTRAQPVAEARQERLAFGNRPFPDAVNDIDAFAQLCTTIHYCGTGETARSVSPCRWTALLAYLLTVDARPSSPFAVVLLSPRPFRVRVSGEQVLSPSGGVLPTSFQ